MGLLLFLLATALRFLLFPVGMAYGVFRSFYRRQFASGLKKADRHLFELARAIDQHGNVVCGDLLNATLIRKDSAHRFGRIEETISEVIGHNLVGSTLTPAGRTLNAVLNFFDPGHSLKAIQP
jgi:hypothetical protein